tara:strand:+ start:744 stop:890 length:147 start_codon:yes stop_codon:yes gene_type:complete
LLILKLKKGKNVKDEAKQDEEDVVVKAERKSAGVEEKQKQEGGDKMYH